MVQDLTIYVNSELGTELEENTQPLVIQAIVIISMNFSYFNYYLFSKVGLNFLKCFLVLLDLYSLYESGPGSCDLCELSSNS